MSLQAIRFSSGSCGDLEILNQLLLPDSTTYEKIGSVSAAWDAIKTMKVRLYEIVNKLNVFVYDVYSFIM